VKKTTLIRWASDSLDAQSILHLVANYGCSNSSLETAQVDYENPVEWEITIEVKRVSDDDQDES
jgi:hypothetical protein